MLKSKDLYGFVSKDFEFGFNNLGQIRKISLVWNYILGFTPDD